MHIAFASRCFMSATALALLPGCAALFQKPTQVAIREPGSRLLGAPRPARPEARKHLEFAWLSEAAYGNTAAGLEAKAEASAAKPGAEAGDAGRVADAVCPVSQHVLLAAGWKPWPGFPGDGLLKLIERYHLRVEVWTRTEPPAVAVAFGGTVFNNKNDWGANLRWFLPKWFLAGHPDEYSEIVQVFAPAFVEEFKRRVQSGDGEWAFLRTASIYATGHSLGGGLAQQFAYALPPDAAVQRVTQVFAFDPSPVTGFYSVGVDVRDANRKSLFIDRIYERGEVLALVRSFTSFFVQPSAQQPTIRGVRYSLFFPASPIAGHSMKQLACKLREASLEAEP